MTLLQRIDALPPDEREAALRLLREEKARRFLSSYAIYASRGTWRPAGFHHLLCDKLEAIEKGTLDRLIVNMPPRHGKALEVHTPVLTQRGWLEIGHIVPGDKVYGTDGRLCSVVAVSPVWHDRELFEVSTDDGCTVLVDGEHEWVVRLCRKHKNICTHTTRYLHDRTCARRPMVKRAAPLEMQEAHLPVDPYALGFWLGDGDAASAAVTIGRQDQEFILGKLAERGCNISRRTVETHFGLLGLQAVLRRAGVLRNKHIPDVYMGGSIQQRIDLLNGLIDSDGYVAKDGQVEFCNTNKALTMRVQELVWSLGVKCSMSVGRAICNGKDCGEKYRLSFYYSRAASLPRKRANCRDAVKQKDTYLSFRRGGRGDTVCIQVDSPDHQFLCGKSFIPTHNSMLISETFPSWYLGRNPDKRVICTAYDQALAERFGRFNRLKLEEHGPVLWGVSVSKSKASQTDWEIQGKAGGMRSVAIGAGITGHGADLLVIDDPHKNAAEADSPTYRERIWQEWQQTLAMRVHAGGRVVVVATRWHEDDLCGRLVASEPDRWHILSLPAVAEPGDPLQRPTGALLWPEGGYDEAWATAQRATVGSRAWAALYQQRPTAAEGNMLRREWVRRYSQAPEHFQRIVQSWDLTFSGGADHDFVVGQVWGAVGADCYLLDQYRRQATFSESLAAIRGMATKWPSASAKLIEEKANGAAVLDVLRREISGLIPIKPKTGKVERVQAIQPLFEAGNIYIPQGLMWADELVDELVSFPAGAHDDQVDAMTQALSWLQAHRGSGRAGVVI